VNVVVRGSEPSGLATILGELIKQNLTRDPDRARLLYPCIATINAVDAGVGVILRISKQGVVLADGAAPRAHLRITGASGDLIAMLAAPLLVGLPDPFTHEGRAVITAVLTRRVLVGGLLRHPVRMSRLVALLSVT
jgi:hypothetical protein